MKLETHADNITRKANSMCYLMVVLKRSGVSLPHLLRFYTTFIRPTLEYAAPVWHPGLTQQLSEQLEGVQRRALHSILPDKSYRQALESTGLPKLCDRRKDLCLNFARSTFNSEFRHWFPAQRHSCHGRNLRNNRQLSIPKCRTLRIQNSPIVYFSRLLNGE